MATSPIRLDQPPPQPADVTAQSGSPNAGIAAMLAQKASQSQGPPGDLSSPSAANPQGALIAQYQAVKKVVEQMARMDENFAPFARRAMAILEAGLGTSISQGKPGISTPPPGQEPSSNRPPEGESAQGFPG